MDCPDCPRFDNEKSRCRDGKVNPRTFEQAFQLSQHIGVRSICVFNDYRERLVSMRQSAERRMVKAKPRR